MSQHHFIIKFDSTTGEWSQDVESELARFDGETIYLPTDNRWVKPTTNKLADVQTVASSVIDRTATEVISNAVNLLNTMYANSGKDN
jgi:hypothetical protein